MNEVQSDIPPEWLRRIIAVTDELYKVQVERDRAEGARFRNDEQLTRLAPLATLLEALGPRALSQLLHGAAIGNHIRLSDDQCLACLDAAKVLRGEQ